MYKNKDLIQELVDYIKKNSKKGYTKDSMRWALINQGYSKIEVDRALKKAEEDFAGTDQEMKVKQSTEYINSAQKSTIDNSPPKKGWRKWFGL